MVFIVWLRSSSFFGSINLDNTDLVSVLRERWDGGVVGGSGGGGESQHHLVSYCFYVLILV